MQSNRALVLPKSLRRLGRWLPAAIVFAAWAWRQHQFVNHYAANVLYWDQWDLYQPLFQKKSWWAGFDLQHGPHRQGLGYLATALLAKCTHWNSRADAFASSFTIIAAAALALILAHRCGVRSVLALAVIPPIVLNIRQYEDFAGPANISHGALPILLIITVGLAWLTPRNTLRPAIVGALTFLLIFTGFAFLAGVITSAMLIIEVANAISSHQKKRIWITTITLLAVAAAWLLFFNGYTIEQNQTPYQPPWDYLRFMAMMQANYFGLADIGTASLITGMAILAATLFIFTSHGRRLCSQGIDRAPVSAVLFFFSAFALLFDITSAWGRTSMGWPTASLQSRYVTLMVPGAIAIFLQLAIQSSRKWSQFAMAIFAIALLFGTMHLSGPELSLAAWLHDGRIAWRDAYLLTGDSTRADQLSNFQIYPRPQIDDRLQYLRENHLNFFADH